jgi:hypothetical protein
MGQRSQIYVKVVKEEKDGTFKENLCASYFGWNYGERMVSRAALLVEYLHDNTYLNIDRESMLKISRMAEINFDFKDIVLSQDILEEVREYGTAEEESLNDAVFNNQDNNDGQLFIRVKVPYADFGEDKPDNEVSYAFRKMRKNDYRVMTADEYLDWNICTGKEKSMDAGWRDHMQNSRHYGPCAIEYTERNISNLDEYAQPMSKEDLRDFIKMTDLEKIIGMTREEINKNIENKGSLKARLQNVYDELDLIQEMDEAQDNEEVVQEIGEAMGAVSNVIDIFEEKDKSETEYERD